MTKLFSMSAKAQRINEESPVSIVVENEIKEEEVKEVVNTPKEEKKSIKKLFKKKK